MLDPELFAAVITKLKVFNYYLGENIEIDLLTRGAHHLQTIGSHTGRLVVITQFDVTNPECIASARARVEKVLAQTSTRLWAVVNNAAVLVLANFEWQTSQLIERQIQVL